MRWVLFMWVCSLKCYGPLAILLLWIYVYPLVVGIEESRQQRRDASPDSITDIKIRKADQIPLGKVHFGEEGGSWQRLGVGGGGFGRWNGYVLHAFFFTITGSSKTPKRFTLTSKEKVSTSCENGYDLWDSIYWSTKTKYSIMAEWWTKKNHSILDLNCAQFRWSSLRCCKTRWQLGLLSTTSICLSAHFVVTMAKHTHRQWKQLGCSCKGEEEKTFNNKLIGDQPRVSESQP